MEVLVTRAGGGGVFSTSGKLEIFHEMRELLGGKGQGSR